MDGISITQVVENEGEVPIFTELTSGPIPLESCILHSEDDYKATYQSLQPVNTYNGYHEYQGAEDLNDEEINNIIMLNEACSSESEEDLISDEDGTPPKRETKQEVKPKDIKKSATVSKKILHVKSQKFKRDKELLKSKTKLKKLKKKLILSNKLKKKKSEGNADVSKQLKKLQMLTKKTEKLEEQSKLLEKKRKKQLKELEREQALLTKTISKSHKDMMMKKKCSGLVGKRNSKPFPKHTSSPHMKVKQKYKKLISPKKSDETKVSPVLVSRSGRVRKLNITKDFKADSKEIKFLEQVSVNNVNESVIEEGVTETVNALVKNVAEKSQKVSNKSKTKTDALQDVLKESLESWFDDVPDSNKKKRRKLDFQITQTTEDFEVKKEDLLLGVTESSEVKTEIKEEVKTNESKSPVKTIAPKSKKLGYVRKRTYNTSITKKVKNYGEKIEFTQMPDPVVVDKIDVVRSDVVEELVQEIKPEPDVDVMCKTEPTDRGESPVINVGNKKKKSKNDVVVVVKENDDNDTLPKVKTKLQKKKLSQKLPKSLVSNKAIKNKKGRKAKSKKDKELVSKKKTGSVEEKENIEKTNSAVSELRKPNRRSSISCITEIVKRRETRSSSLPASDSKFETKSCHVLLKDIADDIKKEPNENGEEKIKTEPVRPKQETNVEIKVESETKEVVDEKPLISAETKKKRRSMKRLKTPPPVEQQSECETSPSSDVRKSIREVKHTQKALEMIVIQSDNKRRRRSSEVSDSSSANNNKKKKKKLTIEEQVGMLSPPSTPTRQGLRKSVSEAFTPNVSLENYLQDKIDQLAKSFKSRWEPGDLIWGNLCGHPYWPSVVIGEPDNKDNYSCVQSTGPRTRLMVHAQFLNDDGQRAWLTEIYTIAFEGLQEFFVFKKNISQQNPKYYNVNRESFVPPRKTKIRDKWLGAVKEAEKLLYKTKDERVCYMMLKYPMKYLSPMSSANIKNKRVKKDINLDGGDDGKDVEQKTIRKKRRSTKLLKTLEESADSADYMNITTSSTEDNEGLKIKLIRSPVKTQEQPVVKKKRKRKLVVMLDKKDEELCAGSDVSGYHTEKSCSEVSGMSTPVTSGDTTSSSSNKQAKINLFAGATVENLCQICYDDEKRPVRCSSCFNRYHLKCLGLEENDKIVTSPKKVKRVGRQKAKKEPEVKEVEEGGGEESKPGDSDNSKDQEITNWKCPDCHNKTNPCFVCNEKTGERRRCYVANCGKFYHVKCLQMYFPQTKFNQGAPLRSGGHYIQTDKSDTGVNDYPQLEIVSCPRHVCHTCTSDHVTEDRPSVSYDKLVRCVKCPASYHFGNYCVPAGSEILSTRQVLCGRHYLDTSVDRVNISWCFLCSSGGTLLCCDMCPSSFHYECLNLTEQPDKYICEECESGRFPCYGEAVWVKLGRYRWWPCKILFPQQIPLNVWDLPHSQCQFVVKFYGSHDHYWFNRGRVFLYQEGDTDNNTRGSKKLNAVFLKALTEAAKDYSKLREARQRGLADVNNVSSMKPPHYIKIRTNKFIGDVQPNLVEHQICDCKASDEQPCSSDSDCINRALMVECNPSSCNAGKGCNNQRFERRLYPPIVPHKTKTRGWGLKCQRDLKKGEFVIEYVGEVIDDAEYKRRVERKHETKDENFYFLTINNNRIIDAGPRGNLARFMNHSCSPNCVTQKWTVNSTTRVGLFAIHDIPAGSELTFNYNLQSSGMEKKECKCGGDNCTGFIGAKINKVVDSSQQEKNRTRNDLKYTEDYCFICDDGGELMVCDMSNCPKVYHLRCVGFETWPNEWWFCPRHKCEICNKPTKTFCKLCPTSYCSAHVDRNFMSDLNGGIVCYKHTTQVKEPVRKPPPARKPSTNRNTLVDQSNIDIQVIVVPDVNALDTNDEILDKRPASQQLVKDVRRASDTKSQIETFMLKKVEEKIKESKLNKESILQIIAGEEDEEVPVTQAQTTAANSVVPAPATADDSKCVSRRSKYFKSSSPEKSMKAEKKADTSQSDTDHGGYGYEFFHPLQAKYLEAKKTSKT